ncbi:FKBP-type peptidyl-prolyl cis-trans isomerase N-terminal domain-containing protein [Klebsiella oxytoca]|uniref:FKBP-type peptidyl-prolyl cis-trans isomerase N-terminal domain-containing protein n=1 Tax=Klebsiella oxytoca TaxID=571 RepID=UPI00157B2C69|nr:FKBP-type peptidyl-prolyl cis-trans isomerase N-terminal domain-containing protein [Klebsiella oxytoca]
MIHRPGIVKTYPRRPLTLAVVLSTLFVLPPAHSAGEDFLDNISKLEIQHPPPSDNGKAESSAGQQRPDGGSTTSKQAPAPQKPAVVRKAASQNNKADNTIAALRKQNAELSAAVKAAEKTRDETTRTLTAQIAVLEARNTAPDVDQSASLNALNKKNAQLTTSAEAAQKKLEESTRTLNAQITALKTQGAQSDSEQKSALAALTKKNTQLTAAAEAAQKKLEESARTLNAQITALKTQGAQSDSEQKSALAALTNKNTQLTAAAEATQKKHEAAVAALTNKNKTLQSALDRVAVKDDKLNLADKNNKNAYALGVFYLTQALSAMEKMTDNGMKLAPAALVSGFNDAYQQKLKIKESEIEKTVNALNDHMSAKFVDIDNKIMAKIKNKKYEILPNGVYFVVDKKGKEKYKLDESLSMNILEKKLDGTPILNTMNSSMMYDKQTDPLMDKILSSGFKGGTVTLYGQAGSLYNPPPEAISPTTLISITFELLP